MTNYLTVNNNVRFNNNFDDNSQIIETADENDDIDDDYNRKNDFDVPSNQYPAYRGGMFIVLFYYSVYLINYYNFKKLLRIS